jgi:DNA-binding transcriptional LysR family regulator
LPTSTSSPGTRGSAAPPAPPAGRPKATLSRRLSGLEAGLDLRLFERGARTLRLTQEGRALYQRMAALLTELDEAAAIASGMDRPRGRLRVSAPLVFFQTAMGKLAAAFALRFPEVQLEVMTEDRAVDMVEEGYDLVIRVNPDLDESLVGRAFLRDRLVVVASPSLARPANGSAVPAVGAWSRRRDRDLAGGDAGRARRHRSSHGPRAVLARDGLRRCSGRRRRRAPTSVAREPRPGVWPSCALGDVDGSEITLRALYPSRRLLSARVSAFLDHVKDAFPQGSPEEAGRLSQRLGPAAVFPLF